MMSAPALGLTKKPSLTQEREKLEKDRVYSIQHVIILVVYFVVIQAWFIIILRQFYVMLFLLLFCPLKTSCRISYSCDAAYPVTRCGLEAMLMRVLYIVYFNFMTKCMLIQLFFCLRCGGLQICSRRLLMVEKYLNFHSRFPLSAIYK